MPISYMENYTSLSSWISAIEIALKHHDVDFTDVIVSADIPLSVLDNPYQRTDVSLIAKAWDIAVEKTGEENIGILAAPDCRPAHWHALGLAMLCSTSVKSALKRACQYQALLTDVVHIETNETQEHFYFTLKSKIPPEQIGLGVLDFGVAGLLSVCRSIFPGEIIPTSVSLERPTPSRTEDFNKFYGTEVSFGCEKNIFQIPRAIAERQLDQSDASLAAHQDALAAEYIQRVVDCNTSQRTRDEISRMLGEGEPCPQKVAENLCLSTRQLQRHLQKENTNFKALLKSVRMELAKNYLNQERRPITEVALQLGFSDHSNFTRAFKSWFDCTPSEYRAKLH